MYYVDNNNDSITSYNSSTDMFIAKYGNDQCTDTGTSISEKVAENNQVTLYPNPTKDGFYISTTNQWQQVEVYDPLGRLVINQILNDNTSYIHLQNAGSGIYMVVLLNGGERVVRKLMVVE